MREKNFNTGLRGVLFEARHHARMGAAIWLYGWLVLRQTHQTGAIGWVLGGAPITYREIEEETGFNRRTLERWMRLLRRNQYIYTETAQGGVTVRILKAKKHIQRVNPDDSLRMARKFAEGVRRVAGDSPQVCASMQDKRLLDERVADGIGSSSVVRIKEKEEPQKIHRTVENAMKFPEKNTSREQNPQQPRAEHEIQECERIQFQQQFRSTLQKRDMSTLCSGKAQHTANDNSQQWQNRDNPENQTRRPVENRGARPNPQKTFPWELRERMRLLRAERDEEVRRELAVGTGPEVRRP
jgi:hypothetical protein